MKKIIIIIVSVLIAGTTIFAQEKAGKKDNMQHTSFYSCSMHTDIAMYKTGICPTCGMNLDVSKKEAMKREVTRTYTCPVHANLTSGKMDNCPKCVTKMNLSPKERMKEKVVKLNVCNMCPDAKCDNPGNCTHCGMDMAKMN
ncbi:MAG: heavy metal-binding domain-containing protein [Chitinophagales bacterium]